MTAAVAQAQTSTTTTRASRFEYNTTTGLLNKEVVEPDTPNSCVETVYAHDTAGNRTTQTVGNCTGATGLAVFTSRTVSTDTYSSYSVTLKNSAGTNIAVTVPTGTYARTTANALAQSETRTVDPRYGTPIQLTGPNALSTTWTLDEFGRRVRETRADGTYTELFYCITGAGLDTSTNTTGCTSLPAVTIPNDAIRFVHSQARNSSNAVIGPYTRTFYDRLDREIRVVTQSFDGNSQATGLIVKDVLFNEFGAKFVETQPYFVNTGSSLATGSTPFGRTQTQYDVLGRAVAVYVSDPATSGTVTMPAIPANLLNGRFTDSGGTAARTTLAYSQLSVTSTNPLGQTSVQEKDPDGRVIRSTDGNGAQVAYLFDALGNLVRTRDGLGNETAAVFDTRGRRTSMTDPNTGQWRYDYNALGELVWQQSPKQYPSQSTTFAYDKLGRMTSRVTQEFTTTFTYDQYANASACTKGVGKLCEVVTSHGVNRKLTYDSLGRPLQTTTTLSGTINGGVTRIFTTSVTYDSASRVASQTYPTGIRVNNTYTTLGFLDRLTNNANGAILWRAQRVNAWGALEQQLAGNNVQTRTSYQAATGRIGTVTAGIGAATDVYNHTYGWDAIGNLASRNDAIGSGSSAVNETFGYDSINRLIRYTVTGAAIPSGSRTVGVAYNAAGNLLTKSDLGTYRYPANGATRPNGVLEVRPYTGGSIGYTYDGNGNVGTTTSSGTASGYEAKYTGLTYTSFNLPDSSAGVAGSNGVSYKWYYDERHARIKEMRGAPGSLDRVTWMLHPDKANGLGFEQEIGGTISNRHYLSAGGQVVGVLTSVGEHTSGTATTITATEYWIKDHLGSSGAITNAAGAVTQRFAYDPWGQRRFADGRADPTGTLVYAYPSASDRGFTGHEHLDDVGVIHMNGRLYDGRIGRFLQADPLIQELARYQGFNRYSYVLNNPLNATDPSGEIIPQLVMAAAVAYYAYVNPKFRPIASIMVGVILALPSGGASLAWTAADAAQVAFAGFASGATATGNLRGGFQGAGMALVFFGAGQAASAIGSNLSATGLETAFNLGNEAAGSGWSAAGNAFSSSGGLGRAALHAAAGCASAAISGADCGRGALTAGLNKMLAGNLPGDQMPFGVVKYSVIGGTIASVGGGKFANGAMMGAFQYLFNELSATKMNRQGYTGLDSDLSEARNVRQREMTPEEAKTIVEGGKLLISLHPLGRATATGFDLVTIVGDVASDRPLAATATGIGMVMGSGMEKILKPIGNEFAGRFGAVYGFLVDKIFGEAFPDRTTPIRATNPICYRVDEC
ncbi:MAG TPA: RHS repeat-associated core domain-containing protein [Burkholderiaceae bacterium]|nr:RHS repeat-associated core domain-containing protein [Burkholderiaceae bacterium]